MCYGATCGFGTVSLMLYAHVVSCRSWLFIPSIKHNNYRGCTDTITTALELHHPSWAKPFEEFPLHWTPTLMTTRWIWLCANPLYWVRIKRMLFILTMRPRYGGEESWKTEACIGLTCVYKIVCWHVIECLTIIFSCIYRERPAAWSSSPTQNEWRNGH